MSADFRARLRSRVNNQSRPATSGLKPEQMQHGNRDAGNAARLRFSSAANRSAIAPAATPVPMLSCVTMLEKLVVELNCDFGMSAKAMC